MEGHLVSQLDEAYEHLQAAFLEALQDAGKNYQEKNGQKNTTREGGRVLEQARENKKTSIQQLAFVSALCQAEKLEQYASKYAVCCRCWITRYF